MDGDLRLCYLGTIPHAQRTILLLSAVITVLHPHGAAMVAEIRRHHPEADGQQLCLHVLLDLMITLSGDWSSGSAVLIPVSAMIEQVVTPSDGPSSAGPGDFVIEMWDLIERLHQDPAFVWHPGTPEPSRN